MKRKKRITIQMLALLMTMALPLTACSNTASNDASPSIPAGSPSASNMDKGINGDEEIDNSDTEIGFIMQEYGDSEIVEILMITYDGSQPAFEEFGGKNPEIELLNNEIEAGPLKMYQDYQDDTLELDSKPNGIDILSYPFADDDFLQIVTTAYIYPETRPDLYTRMWSYCFSKEENRIITLDEMLEDYELDLDDMGKAFETHHESEDGETVVGLEVVGFLINRVPAKPVTHFLLEVMMEGESDPYKSFFMYTPENDELEELDFSMPFDPDIYDMYSMDPPLRYEQDNGSDSGGSGGYGYSGSSSYAGYRVGMDTSGFTTLTKGCEYLMDDLYASMHAYAPMGEAYDEATMTTRLHELEDVSRVVNVTESEEHSTLLTYPAWLLVYETGSNEDTRHCVDVYFQTDSGEYRVHTSVPVDMLTDYHDEVGKRLTTITLEHDGSGSDVSDEDFPDVTDEPTGAPVDEDIIDGEDSAMDLMMDTVSLGEGMAIIMSGDGEIEGEHCWLFSVGKNDEEKFTAEEHYAVTHDGRVFVLDVLTNEYHLYR